MLLAVKFMKRIMPLHDVISILHKWFDKEVYEIVPLLRACQVEPKAIDVALVRAGLRSPEVQLMSRALAELAERMTNQGTSPTLMAQRLLAAGFTLKEVQQLPGKELPRKETLKFQPTETILEKHLSL